MRNMSNAPVAYTRIAVKKFLNDKYPNIKWTPIIRKLPPIIWRKKWDTLAEKHGLPYKRSYLQNLDSIGQGPASYC